MVIIVLILVLYMGGMLAIGIYGSKKSATMTEFLTAGKSGGMFVMVCTYIGAHVGNGIIVGGAQYGAEYGIGGMWFGLGAVLSYVLFALVMSRLIYRRGYITIPDLIRDRYQSKAASVLMALLNICATLGIMAAQIMAGSALFGALGLNPNLGAALMAIVVFIYCALSGMWGVMMTDSVQTTVIFFSTIFCVVVIAMNGGFDGLSAMLPENYFEPVPFDAETLFMMMVPGALNGLISGAAYQRTASCKNEKVAFWAPLISAFALIPFVILPVIIGMYGKSVYPDAPTASILFDVVLNMNPVIAGLMIAAVLSAVMSTMDIGLLNVTANTVNDIYYKTINPKADQKTLGRLSAIVTLVSGIIALYLAISSSSILSLLSSTYSLMNAGALVMVLGGIWWKKGTKEGAIAGAICGMAVIVINMTGLVAVPYISFTPLIPSVIAYVAVSLATQKKSVA